MWRRGSDGRRGRSGGAGDAGGSVGEGAMEITLEELREFMEADLVDVHSDPEFKHSLRNRLWELVQARNAQRGRGSGRH
jgi:hypothetical protein